MPQNTQVTLNGVTYNLVADELLPRGRRGWQRRRRPSQPSDPGVQQIARWSLSGPVGLSREDVTTGRLSVDYTQNMDTLYDQLLLPVARRNPIDLAAMDSAGSNLTLPFFLPTTLGGTSVGNTKFIQEDRTVLEFGRGQSFTVVNPETMEVVATYAKGAEILGMTVWYNHGLISYGTGDDVERVVAVSPTSGVTFEDVTGVQAKAMTVGPDRWWAIDAGGSVENRVFYALDNLANFSEPFVVGDPEIPATGIGTYGRTGIAGSEVGAYGFTVLGEPTRVLESLRQNRSTENGRHIVSLWGWTYITTVLGLKATVPGQIENPAGPGTDRRYEGPSGRPTAIWATKDALFLAEVTPEGDTYLYRGEFDDGRYGGNTAGTGNPAWFPFHYLPATETEVISATGLRPTPTVIVGEGPQASYYTLGRMQRDINDPLYRFETGTGLWYGSTMMRSSTMHKNIRYFVVLTDDVNASNYFQIAVSIDDDAYVNVGDAITSTGHKFVRPVQGGVPQTNVNGHTIKPRITCVSTSTTNPPKMRGFLEMVYDERPDTITEHTFALQIGQTGNTNPTDLEELYDLYGAHGSAESPMEFQYPGYPDIHYGFVVSIEEIKDIEGDGVQAAVVTVQEWDTGHG